MEWSFVIKHGLLRLVFTVQNVSSTAFPRWIPKQRNVWFGLFRQRICSRVKFLWFESPSERSDSSTVMRVSYRDFHQIFMWSFQCFVWFCIRQGYARSFHAMTTWWLHGNFFFQANVADKRRENHNSDKMQTSFLVTYLREVCRRNRILNSNPAFARPH